MLTICHLIQWYSVGLQKQLGIPGVCLLLLRKFGKLRFAIHLSVGVERPNNILQLIASCISGDIPVKEHPRLEVIQSVIGPLWGTTLEEHPAGCYDRSRCDRQCGGHQ
jgi:hypothetical protein